MSASRLTANDTFMLMAMTLAQRGTCARRKVGCIFVNEQTHIIASGYNGPAQGMAHCIEQPCAGASAPSGTNLDLCEAIHAEQNALLQCPDVTKIHICYATCLPCMHCIKLLLNTACYEIVYLEEYPHREQVEKLWVHKGGRRMYQYTPTRASIPPIA